MFVSNSISAVFRMLLTDGALCSSHVKTKRALAVLPNIQWIQLAVARDALTVNSNIVWALERNARFLPSYTVYSHICWGHGVVLCLKPVADRVEGLDTAVVQAGHLSQATKPSTRFMSALEKEIDLMWDYQKVDVMPLGYIQWRQDFERLLEYAGYGLSAELKSEMLEHLNGEVRADGDKWTHYCTAVSCKGGGNIQKSAQPLVNTFVRSLLVLVCKFSFEIVAFEGPNQENRSAERFTRWQTRHTMDRQSAIHKQIDRQTNKRADRYSQTDRQTDKHEDIQTNRDIGDATYR